MPDMDETLQMLLDMAEDQAKTVLLGTNQSLVPIFILYQPYNKIDLVPFAFQNSEEKYLMLAILKQFMREKHTIAYSHLSEAWVATQAHPYSENDPPPSERPDRKEAVMAFATDGVNTKHKMWGIVRSSDGKVERLDLQPHYDGIMGEFTKLLGRTA